MRPDLIEGEPRRRLIGRTRVRVALAAGAVLGGLWLALVGQLKAGDDPVLKPASNTTTTGTTSTPSSTETTTSETTTSKTTTTPQTETQTTTTSTSTTASTSTSSQS